MVPLTRIAIDSEVCGGRPCIKGTRVRVTDLVGLIAEGVSTPQIIKDFPYLTEADVQQALAYAAVSLDHPIVLVA